MDRRGRDLMVVWFTPTYAISAYHNYSLQHYVIKFVSHLQQVGDLLRVLRFPPSNKTDSHNITEIFIFESGVKHHNSNPFMCMFMNHLNYSSYHNDSSSEEYSTTQQMHRQTKTLPEETNLFVQEPSSSHAEFQINENNQDNSSSDGHIDKDITSEEDKDVWNTVDVPVCISSESESEDQDCLLPEYLASWANEFKIKHPPNCPGDSIYPSRLVVI